jgi:hypothetical protein
MISITTTLEPDADGTLHLPLPPELRQERKVEVIATLKPVHEATATARSRFGCLAGKIEMAPDFDEPLADF